ncbi:MAG TPA: TIR domain-containing protein [Saprospiraceae bacterium]|nr:TIR domain-containing protein [Saprospiraceae bacterium]
MRVTVVGSFKKELSIHNKVNIASQKKDFERFKNACIEIGKALAEDGHRLIVAHAEKPLTAEALALSGFRTKEPNKFYKCIQHKGDADLKAHLDAVEMSDVVILIGGGNGTYASGLSALRRRKVIIPILAFEGSAKDLCEIQEIDKIVTDEIRNLDLNSDKWLKSLTNAVRSVLKQYPRVLIIHGRGDSGIGLKDKLKTESKSNKELLGVADPVIMNLTGSGAVTVPSVFEELASQVSAAIVIVTADDIGGFARSPGKEETIPATSLKLKVRARENVWVEVGWFWGRLGREKVFLWLKDKVEIPSDLQGVARTNAENLDLAWPSISSFLIKMRSSE